MKQPAESNPGAKRLPRLLTYQEVAEACGICKKTVSLAVQRGELVAVNAPGTHGNAGKRITEESLQRYLREALHASPPAKRKPLVRVA
jgi:hypothetical protein